MNRLQLFPIKTHALEAAKPSSAFQPGRLTGRSWILLLLLLAQPLGAIEATWEYAVQATATVQTSPPQINLSWLQDSTGIPSSYTVYRKHLAQPDWGTGFALPGAVTNYTDTNVVLGAAYEYQIVKSNATYTGYGYLYSGIELPFAENRGKLLLMVDNTYAADLAQELDRLQQDLAGDGWTVLRHEVARTDSVSRVKAVIQTDYLADPAQVKAVFLFGHVPVPYAGDFAPDLHYPQHGGAWPADVYYGIMEGVWTDTTVNDTGADNSRNWNVPGDGKFDQTDLPGPVVLQIGRVDMANLPGRNTWNGPPTFPSESELLRQYLKKDHAYRQRLLDVPRRALVYDGFGINEGDAYAASGWRNFVPMLGATNINNLVNQGEWIGVLSTNAYLWTYGCGAGSFTSVGGMGTNGPYQDVYTTDIAAADAQAVFTLLYGSWFGDWDSEDNIMRAMLATPTYGLACAFSGRPHWYLQHMALGETIGFSTLLTQNNGSNDVYRTEYNDFAHQIHIALMGDPTLRLYPVSPPSALSAIPASGTVTLSWKASADPVRGYHVYRAATPSGPFARLTTVLTDGTNFTDGAAAPGAYTYLVRAVALGNSPSGTFFNPSQGAFLNISVTNQVRLQFDEIPASLPETGSYQLRALTPDLLELRLINTKPPDPSPVDSWTFIDTHGVITLPSTNAFAVTIDGRPVAVRALGFKRRPLYAPLAQRDLRIGNYLYLQLATTNSFLSDPVTIGLKNPAATLWPSNLSFSTTTDPARFNPAIHVNQVGYTTSFPKKAMIGYYLGSLGEMNIPAAAGFTLLDTHSNLPVYRGTLLARPDVGYEYSPTPYQQVFEADFSEYRIPGEYQLQVPGLGTSPPFWIDDGIAMAFARTYALGIYHQRCGTNNVMPFTRFTHDVCHSALADIPIPSWSFGFTWATLADKSADYTNNARHTAPQLKDEGSQLYPFWKQGKIDVSGGHHDAGDYSKYTINSAAFIHYLIFAVDAFPGVADLDNLGLPESGDGISDLLQEAKWEADFLAKMQDADGGFFFLVYPRDREYESNVLPDHGDPQVVWPKTTAVTAAAVAALAQCASSPQFKQHYPAAAAQYLDQAKRGWYFLTSAIAKYGKDGAYQKITHYGDNFMHDDELAWAACELYLATGDSIYHQALQTWFDPADPATRQWGWVRMADSYGNAIRSYAFAAKTGRLATNQLNSAFLAKCEAEILAAGNDALAWAQQNAYGTSFPRETKRFRTAGWYFSSAQAFDITVAYQLDPKPEYLDAILSNLNYEAGCNPVNVSYLTGLGWQRQREIVDQYAQNDRRVLPPSGLPIGNIQDGFANLKNYGLELAELCFPPDQQLSAPYPFYDHWGDSFNVTTEFVILDQARSLASVAFLAAQTPLKNQPWQSASAAIVGWPGVAAIGTPVTAQLVVTNLDISAARVVWEAKDQEPVLGSSATFYPTNNGVFWMEAEALWPDGRRAFAATSLFATNGLPTVMVTATAPNASEAGPVPGVFTFVRDGNTDAPLTIQYRLAGTAAKWIDYRRPEGDMPEFVVVPAGANTATLTIVPVVDNLVEGPQTVILTIAPQPYYNVGAPASAIVTIADKEVPLVTVTATEPYASRAGPRPGVFTFTRSSGTNYDLTVNFELTGTAVKWQDYRRLQGDMPTEILIPTGTNSATLAIYSVAPNFLGPNPTVILTLVTNQAYAIGASNTATVTIVAQFVQGLLPVITSLAMTTNGAVITWSSEPGWTYKVSYANDLFGSQWVDASQNLVATNTLTSWTDPAGGFGQRFYRIIKVP